MPQDWIERPAGFTALTLQGNLKAGVRVIEGQLIPCGSGRFLAELVEPAQAAPSVLRTSAPRSGGPLEGVWRGSVACSANRRGKTEAYPLELHLGMDGAGVGGVGILQVYKARGSGSGPAFNQIFAISGDFSDNRIVLDKLLVIDRGGAPIALRSITAALVAPDRLAGDVRLSGCQTVNLDRSGELPETPVPEGISGIWAGSTSGDRPTAIVLQVAEGEAELHASWPANKPEIERDRLRLSILPIDLGGGRVCLVANGNP